MLWFAQALDAAVSLLVVAGSVLYLLVPWVKRHSRRWLKPALRNRRAYLLAFECSGVFLSVWGVLGQVIRQYPRLVDVLRVQQVDLPGLVASAGLHLDLATLDWLRLCLLAMVLGCVLAGLLCRRYGRREVFPDIRRALRYAAHESPRPVYAASYFAARAGDEAVTTEIRDPADEARWLAAVAALRATVDRLSAEIRPVRQGENVRVVYEAGGGQMDYYRFGAHACLVVAPYPPGGAPADDVYREGIAKARRLIAAIQLLASIHGA